MNTTETLYIFGLCISSEKLKGFGMGDGWQIKKGAYEALVRYEDVKASFHDVLCFVMHNGVMIGSKRYSGENTQPRIIEKFVASIILKYEEDNKAAEHWARQTVLLAVDDERELYQEQSHGHRGEDFHSDG
jgi:hypothetical protein